MRGTKPIEIPLPAAGESFAPSSRLFPFCFRFLGLDEGLSPAGLGHSEFEMPSIAQQDVESAFEFTARIHFRGGQGIDAAFRAVLQCELGQLQHGPVDVVQCFLGVGIGRIPECEPFLGRRRAGLELVARSLVQRAREEADRYQLR